MEAHYKNGITTLDTADIYGASEALVGRYMKTNPDAIPLTKFCCFKFLDEIDKAEVRSRITKVNHVALLVSQYLKSPLSQSQYKISYFILFHFFTGVRTPSGTISPTRPVFLVQLRYQKIC